MNTNRTLVSLLAGALLISAAPMSRGQGESNMDWNEQYRSSYEVPLGQYTGKSPFMRGMARPTSKPAVAKPAPTPKPAAPALKTTCDDATWGLIKMDKTMPAEASLGGEFTAELKLTALACAADVVVKDTVPAGASYVRSEPAATVSGNQLTWNLGNLDAGEARTLKVTFKAEKEGTLVNCASVSANPRTCASTFVGKPALTITKSGPETALLNADVAYQVVVKNTGTSIARNVVLKDAVPEGMSGQPVTIQVGDLAPGQSKPFTVTFKATKRGKVCNKATATSSNTGEVSAEACTVVLVPGLKVEKSGTKEQILGRNADYEIVVSNTGDTALSNVVVTDTAPAATTIVAAPGANVSGNKATWTIAQLKAGEKQTLTVKLASKTEGTHCNGVVASAGVMSATAEACTVWRGISAVLLEVVDDPDPIQVGEVTTYTIKVTNQGFANINNVKVVYVSDEETDPVSSAQGTVSGKNVNFPVVTTIAPKAAVTYKVVVKGVKVGDARNKVILTSSELKTPVEEEESTTVY